MRNSFILVRSLPVNLEEDCVCVTEREREREPGKERERWMWRNIHTSIIFVRYVVGSDRSLKIRDGRMYFEGHCFSVLTQDEKKISLGELNEQNTLSDYSGALDPLCCSAQTASAELLRSQGWKKKKNNNCGLAGQLPDKCVQLKKRESAQSASHGLRLNTSALGLHAATQGVNTNWGTIWSSFNLDTIKMPVGLLF